MSDAKYWRDSGLESRYPYSIELSIPPPSPSHPPIIEEEPTYGSSKGWAEMIRKVYEVDPLLCPQCGDQMCIIAFLTDYAGVDRIIRHLKLTFEAERPPPPHTV